MKRPIGDIAASVKQRLLNVARERGEEAAASVPQRNTAPGDPEVWGPEAVLSRWWFA